MLCPVSQGENELSIRAKTLFALLLFAVLITAPASAFGAPSKAQKMAQARAVKARIDELNNKIDIADENFVEARDRHYKLLTQARAAARRERKANNRILVLQNHLGTRASDMYRAGPLGFLDVLLGAKSFDAFAATWDVLKQLNQDDAESVAELKIARAEAAAAHKELAAKEQAAAEQVAVMAAQEASYKQARATRAAKLRGIQAEINAIQAAEDAAARAAVRAGNWGGGGDSESWPNPTIPAHGSVVTYARSRLGLPYVWAASGPRAFDCSGLAMWCYRRVGISLPHSSRAQIGSGQRVSRANIQPGDLVFFGSPIHHVGIYIGGGMMIHAPHSGSVVQVAPAFRGDYSGACRP